ncbi:hypothetical protein Nepgr_033263 [Nepenthes gracilis]|uniref:Uncharacterized protein n=1 Tax=Nepenthes gracilis TaxID=150966 RepID=A0AAD3TKW5_NEPGR|nr:hypothetical protein Nepgr_033263 [Nepenthes gracilis]
MRAIALPGVGSSGPSSLATRAHHSDEAKYGLGFPSYPRLHNGILSSYDHASIRRADEVKAVAAQIKVVNEPNDEGAMFTRPGKLSDSFPQPYANGQAARFAIGGAYLPNLIITKARHNAEPEIEERKLVTAYGTIFTRSLLPMIINVSHVVERLRNDDGVAIS